jgi:hypothetical protein
MILNLSAAYQPTENEVWVEFHSTQNDGVTVTVADKIKLVLLIENVSDIGSTAYLPISPELVVDAAYVGPNKNYEIKFRNPLSTMDLWIEVTATFGLTDIQKRVSVGQALPSSTSMDLPDNLIYEIDHFDRPETLGENHVPNTNTVILAPEIRQYSEVFDFTLGKPVEDFEGLSYTGGGNRLLINNQNSMFDLQVLDRSYWEMSSFAFIEPTATNLLSNAFFLTATNTSLPPVGYQVDAGGALLTQKLDFDYSVSDAVKIWTLRFIQNSVMPAFNEVKVDSVATVPCVGGTNYSFSSYVKVRNMTNTTKVTRLTLRLAWFDGTTFLLNSEQNLNPADFRQLDLASMSAVAPLNANQVRATLLLGSVDSGDDVELSLLGWQLEEGAVPTTRTLTTRAADQLTIDTYNAANQKLRFETIVGFDSLGTARQFLQGPIDVTFTGASTLLVSIPEAATTLTVPLVFSAGDVLDVTIEHETGKNLTVFRDGQSIGTVALAAYTATPAPLNFIGIGVELLRLTVFSRRGD